MPPAETYLESLEEIRDAIMARRQAGAKGPAAAPAAAAPPPMTEDAASGTQLFRPTFRPPLALLYVLDDGSKDDGECVRIRGDRLLIGREEGDVRIPFDSRMSARHAELVRETLADGSQRWVLQDLRSTNGTFIRISQSIVRPGGEFLIGRARFRLDPPAAASEAANRAPPARTVGWQGAGPREAYPALVELDPIGGVGRRVPLSQSEYWIGRDKECAIVRADDDFVSPRHARLMRDHHQNWHIENQRSTNGVWLRIERIEIDRFGQFQLGEQRFLLKVLS
jgi:pSer/pThr/pTyr-binding forkhead associated (FHA) protein